MSFLLNVEYDHYCDVVFEVFSFPSARNAASIYILKPSERRNMQLLLNILRF